MTSYLRSWGLCSACSHESKTHAMPVGKADTEQEAGQPVQIVADSRQLGSADMTPDATQHGVTLPPPSSPEQIVILANSHMDELKAPLLAVTSGEGDSEADTDALNTVPPPQHSTWKWGVLTVVCIAVSVVASLAFSTSFALVMAVISASGDAMALVRTHTHKHTQTHTHHILSLSLSHTYTHTHTRTHTRIASACQSQHALWIACMHTVECSKLAQAVRAPCPCLCMRRWASLVSSPCT